MSKIAIKRLTDSDLTFFQWHFSNVDRGGNQKAINLNADVFINKLYPVLPRLVETAFTVDLHIYGPAGAPADILARKILKSATYKNWRLNGEYVSNPHHMPNRYNSLVAGDYAILAFEGDLTPDHLKMVLISQSNLLDLNAHTQIANFMGGASMRAISANELDVIIGASQVASNHPIRIPEFEAALEDSAMGGGVDASKLEMWVPNYKISKRDLVKARTRADEVGELGEEFVNHALQLELRNNTISHFLWASKDNPIQAYDFVVNSTTYIDVKSTFGVFNKTLHISINELLHMAYHPDYRIFRVHDINGENATITMTTPLQLFANNILGSIKHIPQGVRPDSFSVDPAQLPIASKINIHMPR